MERKGSSKIRYPSAWGNFMDNNNLSWNLGHFPSEILAARADGFDFPGLTSPYVYRGYPKSIFSWHTEELDLYSLIYLHWGGEKQWYSVPLTHARKFEKLESLLFKVSCASHMRHKTSVISPDVLDLFDIKYFKHLHEPRTFMVTYPYGYHMGFNLNHNLAVANNIADAEYWPAFGFASVNCNACEDVYPNKTWMPLMTVMESRLNIGKSADQRYS